MGTVSRMRGSLLVLCFVVACGPGVRQSDDTGGDDVDGSSNPVCPVCTADNTGVVDCEGNVTECATDQACANGVCSDPCDAAEENHSSVGCEYYAVDMDAASGP